MILEINKLINKTKKKIKKSKKKDKKLLKVRLQALKEARAIMVAPKDPVMPPLYQDDAGTIRFQANPIIDHWISTRQMDLNEVSIWYQTNGIDPKWYSQLQQFNGYSLSGWGTLHCVTDREWERAQVRKEATFNES